MTASLVSTAAFLTACGDNDKGSSAPSSILEKERQDVQVTEVLKKKAEELLGAAEVAEANGVTADGSITSVRKAAAEVARQAAGADQTARKEALIKGINENTGRLKNLIVRAVGELRSDSNYTWLEEAASVNLKSFRELVAKQTNYAEIVNGNYDAFVDAIALRQDIQGMFPVRATDPEKKAYVKGILTKAVEIGLKQVINLEPEETALSSGSIKDISSTVSFRDARTSLGGRVDGRSLSVNGVNGQAVSLEMPLFVQLKGDVNGAKATEAATGSVAYRLGNTVIGAIQGYANSGAGFGFEGRQLESSLVASHSFGGLFIEGQAGSVAAANVHSSDWSGVRSQLTVGFDTSFVTPFVQISHRQLDSDGSHQLNETVGYVGLDVDVANLAADTYSVNTRLLAKVGYGEQAWSKGSKDLGSTAGVRGSVEWTAGVNLNSGISFSTNLGLDTLSGSSAGLTVSLDR